MNCSTIGLELSSLIKAPTVAVKQSMYRVIRCLRTEPQLSLRCFFILFFKNVPKHPCPVRVCVKWKSRCSGPHVIQSLISGINLYVHLPLLDESQEFQWHLPRQNTEGIEGYRATGSPDWGRIHYHGLNNLVVKFSGEQNCLCFIVCQLESFTGIPNRHLLQSGFSQSNQLGQNFTNYDYSEVVCIPDQVYIFSHFYFQQLIIQNVPQQRPDHRALGNPPENLKALLIMLDHLTVLNAFLTSSIISMQWWPSLLALVLCFVISDMASKVERPFRNPN
ncbi:uncharacterized protein LOC117609861 isoform X1 [Osmia lignaria lignaria]|uniref:uncharacterized protein LOC117609861 isoform X1 n=1 Tax=Osmia lignaria lignaria TaxID=1437193 RepID=UPI00402BE4CD